MEHNISQPSTTLSVTACELHPSYWRGSHTQISKPLVTLVHSAHLDTTAASQILQQVMMTCPPMPTLVIKNVELRGRYTDPTTTTNYNSYYVRKVTWKFKSQRPFTRKTHKLANTSILKLRLKLQKRSSNQFSSSSPGTQPSEIPATQQNPTLWVFEDFRMQLLRLFGVSRCGFGESAFRACLGRWGWGLEVLPDDLLDTSLGGS